MCHYLVASFINRYCHQTARKCASRTLARPYLTACWCHNNTSRRKDPADLVRESAAYPLATSLTRFFIWTVIVARPYCDEIWFLDKNMRTMAAAFPDWEPTFCYILRFGCIQHVLSSYCVSPFPPHALSLKPYVKFYIYEKKRKTEYTAVTSFNSNVNQIINAPIISNSFKCSLV